jgi:hypothetical protein
MLDGIEEKKELDIWKQVIEHFPSEWRTNIYKSLVKVEDFFYDKLAKIAIFGHYPRY